MRPELDACGIGFVADAQGRSSRAIVEAALNGLACVKHRGAVAADARTADGSGVLIPIPASLFGEDHGLAPVKEARLVRGHGGGSYRGSPAPRGRRVSRPARRSVG